MTEQQFKLIYEKVQEKLMKRILWHINDETLAKDLFQEILIVFWLKAPKNKEEQELIYYLFAIARNISIKEVNKREKLRVTVRSLDWIFEGKMDEDHRIQLAKDYVYPKEELRVANKIDKEISKLPDYLRWPIYKKYIEGKSNLVVSGELNLERPILKSYLMTGRKKLQKTLKEEYYK